ncbi:amidase [Ramlibacter alkalitolerans]|uniref:Amidase n=1 Tax=Ramlibacter alkalitolerans TaxID=2039631 RepID=A0ABS1JK22_9BURK|nr:amidase [Ramlibacter alkalitolerans]MBL0424583.1 amidase [Ramlibacter alkalitolerans]
MPLPDLHSTRERLRHGETSAADELGAAVAAAHSGSNTHVFLKTRFEASAAEAAQVAAAAPLAGLPVSIKDLFDFAGDVTTAGSLALVQAEPARIDAPSVARLRAAGGVVVGRTNMSEFAFSGVGVNPHYGTPPNPCDARTPRIPGGSSSGGAVSVATGASFIGLGSDTGGSIRIPAALCGIVGFKNTARLTPLEGAYPLSGTLDTVCAMTRSVRDAVLAHEIIAARKVVRVDTPLAGYRLAVATTQMLDGVDGTVARAFERTLRRLRDAGARIDEIPLWQIQDLGSIQSTGGFAAAESYAWHRQLLAREGSRYDPRVRLRIERGAAMKAYEYIELQRARSAWVREVGQALAGFDAVLSPTVPIVAPPIADLAPGGERDEAFFRVNALLLRNTSVVNMLDGCAISLPCHAADELPVGLMAWHGALHDDKILNLAIQIENLLTTTTTTT